MFKFTRNHFYMPILALPSCASLAGQPPPGHFPILFADLGPLLQLLLTFALVYNTQVPS